MVPCNYLRSTLRRAGWYLVDLTFPTALTEEEGGPSAWLTPRSDQVLLKYICALKGCNGEVPQRYSGFYHGN